MTDEARHRHWDGTRVGHIPRVPRLASPALGPADEIDRVGKVDMINTHAVNAGHDAMRGHVKVRDEVGLGGRALHAVASNEGTEAHAAAGRENREWFLA